MRIVYLNKYNLLKRRKILLSVKFPEKLSVLFQEKKNFIKYNEIPQIFLAFSRFLVTLPAITYPKSNNPRIIDFRQTDKLIAGCLSFQRSVVFFPSGEISVTLKGI